MCGPHQVWPLRSECCGRGVPTKVVCAECMKMCCLGGKNSVVKGLMSRCGLSHESAEDGYKGSWVKVCASKLWNMAFMWGNFSHMLRTSQSVTVQKLPVTVTTLLLNWQ